MMLSDDEAVAVVLGLRSARALPWRTTAAASAPAKVPRPLIERLDSLMSTAQFTTAVSASAPVGAENLLRLTTVTEERRTVVIEYTAWDGTEPQREPDVNGLVFRSGRRYATGFDHGREDVRTFRLDRTAAVSPSDDTSNVPAVFDATTQVVPDIAGIPWAHEVSVALHITLVEAAERLPMSVGRPPRALAASRSRRAPRASMAEL